MGWNVYMIISDVNNGEGEEDSRKQSWTTGISFSFTAMKYDKATSWFHQSFVSWRYTDRLVVVISDLRIIDIKKLECVEVTLASLRDFKGVNALLPRQVLSVARTGLTTVFG